MNWIALTSGSHVVSASPSRWSCAVKQSRRRPEELGTFGRHLGSIIGVCPGLEKKLHEVQALLVHRLTQCAPIAVMGIIGVCPGLEKTLHEVQALLAHRQTQCAPIADALTSATLTFPPFLSLRLGY